MRKAFTLIELLVVIAIIAVLAALLMPALEAARDAATQAADLANYKQYPLMVNMYAFDHGGTMPWIKGTWLPDGLGGIPAMNDPSSTRYGGYKNPISGAWLSSEMNTHSFTGGPGNPYSGTCPENDGRDRCYWNCTPDDDPNRNCEQTHYALMADYCGSPKIFTMPSDQISTVDWRPCYNHDGVGMYSSCCSEEIAKQDAGNANAHACWYGGDGVGGANCEGWTVNMMFGYQGCDLYPVPVYGTWTVDQWKLNSVGIQAGWRPEMEDNYGGNYGNPQSGPGERVTYTRYLTEGTPGKDGAYMCRSVWGASGSAVEVGGSTRTFQTYNDNIGMMYDIPVYNRTTTADNDGDGFNDTAYTAAIQASVNNRWWSQVRYGGWKEIIEVELGTYHGMNYY